jgi:hypothetical protein
MCSSCGRKYQAEQEESEAQLAQLDALLGGVFLTSDDPSTYTDQMKQEAAVVKNISK